MFVFLHYSSPSEKELKSKKVSGKSKANGESSSTGPRRNNARQHKSAFARLGDDSDDEDDCQNEIELIQNIEKRLVNSNKHASSPNTLKLPVYLATPDAAKMPSSEASAAANIAAAMKKRIVVIGADTIQSESAEKETQAAQQVAPTPHLQSEMTQQQPPQNQKQEQHAELQQAAATNSSPPEQQQQTTPHVAKTKAAASVNSNKKAAASSTRSG